MLWVIKARWEECRNQFKSLLRTAYINTARIILTNVVNAVLTAKAFGSGLSNWTTNKNVHVARLLSFIGLSTS